MLLCCLKYEKKKQKVKTQETNAYINMCGM